MAFANGHLIAKDTVYAIHFLIARDFPMITDADKSNAHTGSSVVEFVGITGGIGLIEIPGLKPIQFLKSNMPHQAAALRFIQPCLSMMYQEKSNQAAAEMIFRHAGDRNPSRGGAGGKAEIFSYSFLNEGIIQSGNGGNAESYHTTSFGGNGGDILVISNLSDPDNLSKNIGFFISGNGGYSRTQSGYSYGSKGGDLGFIYQTTRRDYQREQRFKIMVGIRLT